MGGLPLPHRPHRISDSAIHSQTQDTEMQFTRANDCASLKRKKDPESSVFLESFQLAKRYFAPTYSFTPPRSLVTTMTSSRKYEGLTDSRHDELVRLQVQLFPELRTTSPEVTLAAIVMLRDRGALYWSNHEDNDISGTRLADEAGNVEDRFQFDDSGGHDLLSGLDDADDDPYRSEDHDRKWQKCSYQSRVNNFEKAMKQANEIMEARIRDHSFDGLLKIQQRLFNERRLGFERAWETYGAQSGSISYADGQDERNELFMGVEEGFEARIALSEVVDADHMETD